MRLQQSASSTFGYSPQASTTASDSNSGGTSQATARKVLFGSVWSALGLSGSTGGVQDIASALSSALSTGLASGQDLAPQLTQTVDNALDKVSQQLEAQGVSAGHVAKLVAKFRQDLADALSGAAAAAASGATPSAPNAGGSSAGISGVTGTTTGVNATSGTNTATGSSAGSPTSAGVTGGASANTGPSAIAGSGTSTATGTGVPTGVGTIAGATNTPGGGNAAVSSLAEFASIRESETLTIQTTDGARITLRFGARASEFGASQTQADGSTTSAAALFASSKFQVEVSGNLSSADLTAINNIVSQVDSLATEFFSGDVQDAFAAAASISADPSEIAGFSLQMSYSATVYQQASATVAPSAAVPPVVTIPTSTDQASPDSTQYIIRTRASWQLWNLTPTTSTLPTTLTNAPGASATNTAATNQTAEANGATGTTAAAGTAPDSAATTPTDPSGATSTSPSATSATAQQVIANFLQNALAKLTVASNGSSAALSGRWGIQLLAAALPTYAQSQTAVAGSQAGNNPAPSGNGTPAVTQVATQAARLAAATLVQLVN